MDPEAVAGLVRSMLSDAGIIISRDAEDYLSVSLAADRALVRREAEKLIAYAGESGKIDLESAEACVGDSAERSMDDLVLAAGDGDAATVDRTLQKLFAEGASPIALLRAAQRHFARLHLANSRVSAGESADNVMASLRPPVFFKTKPRFRRQLDHWRRERLMDALDRLADTEAECKRTGMPAETLCSRTLLQIASLGRRRR
jgi:DNA polymerase-3 subunit delta